MLDWLLPALLDVSHGVVLVFYRYLKVNLWSSGAWRISWRTATKSTEMRRGSEGPSTDLLPLCLLRKTSWLLLCVSESKCASGNWAVSNNWGWILDVWLGLKMRKCILNVPGRTSCFTDQFVVRSSSCQLKGRSLQLGRLSSVGAVDMLVFLRLNRLQRIIQQLFWGSACRKDAPVCAVTWAVPSHLRLLVVRMTQQIKWRLNSISAMSASLLLLFHSEDRKYQCGVEHECGTEPSALDQLNWTDWSPWWKSAHLSVLRLTAVRQMMETADSTRNNQTHLL